MASTMGLSDALQTDLDLLIILHDNESAANTDIQATGLTTYGAQTTFTPTGKQTVNQVGAGSLGPPAREAVALLLLRVLGPV